MSKKRGSLLSYRPDIKVVDATLRDGGLVNDFRFTEDFVRDLYAANVAAGIDYMEFGYKASKDIFDPKDFGPWKFWQTLADAITNVTLSHVRKVSLI